MAVTKIHAVYLHYKNASTTHECCKAMNEILYDLRHRSTEEIVQDKFLKKFPTGYVFNLCLWINDLNEEPRDITEELEDIALRKGTLFSDDQVFITSKEFQNMMGCSKRPVTTPFIDSMKDRLEKEYPGVPFRDALLHHTLEKRVMC